MSAYEELLEKIAELERRQLFPTAAQFDELIEAVNKLAAEVNREARREAYEDVNAYTFEKAQDLIP